MEWCRQTGRGGQLNQLPLRARTGLSSIISGGCREGQVVMEVDGGGGVRERGGAGGSQRGACSLATRRCRLACRAAHCSCRFESGEILSFGAAGGRLPRPRRASKRRRQRSGVRRSGWPPWEPPGGQTGRRPGAGRRASLRPAAAPGASPRRPTSRARSSAEQQQRRGGAVRTARAGCAGPHRTTSPLLTALLASWVWARRALPAATAAPPLRPLREGVRVVCAARVWCHPGTRHATAATATSHKGTPAHRRRRRSA